jgi:FMN phosphatase YigB (HAD superfamily)
VFTYAPEFPIVASDWDGTIADTFTPSPNGRGVESGYRYALGKMFGVQDLLDQIGGLCNRAPAEVIDAILELNSSLQKNGLDYCAQNKRELDEFVPRGKGLQKRNPTAAERLTETLVRVRLQYLMPEITVQWPKPFQGVLDALELFRSRGLRVAIISSGHTAFIEKSCKVWGVRAPEIIVSDDDMRALGQPTHLTCKPSRLLMETMLQRAYLSSVGSTSSVTYRTVTFIGDCSIRDRALARNSGVPFWWYNPQRADAPQDFGPDELQFQSWKDVHKLLG